MDVITEGLFLSCLVLSFSWRPVFYSFGHFFWYSKHEKLFECWNKPGLIEFSWLPGDPAIIQTEYTPKAAATKSMFRFYSCDNGRERTETLSIMSRGRGKKNRNDEQGLSRDIIQEHRCGLWDVPRHPDEKSNMSEMFAFSRLVRHLPWGSFGSCDWLTVSWSSSPNTHKPEVLPVSRPRHGKDRWHHDCLIWHSDHQERPKYRAIWSQHSSIQCRI